MIYLVEYFQIKSVSAIESILKIPWKAPREIHPREIHPREIPREIPLEIPLEIPREIPREMP